MTIALYSLFRTGHNSIMTWMKANWPDDQYRFIHFDDQPLVLSQEASRHIIVLRDPYNWFASWLVAIRKWAAQSSIDESKPQLIEIWKVHAREYLKDQNEIMFILFNLWCKHPGYRRLIAKELGMGLKDNQCHFVSGEGGGSSWHDTQFDGESYKMDVLNRWKLMDGDEEYRNLMLDPELSDLCKEIFGYGCPL